MHTDRLFNMPALAAAVFFGIFILLAAASLFGQYRLRQSGGVAGRLLKEFNARVYAWWVISIILLLAFNLGRVGMIMLFAAASFAAMREFMTHVYRYRGDHNAVAACFYILLPLQYYFVLTGWFSMFTIFIPVYAFLLLPIIVQLSGKNDHFFERTAKIQWGVMITVYCLSHVPALMLLDVKNFAGNNILLLLFMLVSVHGSDIAYYLWRRTAGSQGVRRIFSGATVSIGTAAVIAGALFWITPFSPIQAAAIGIMLGSMGFFGSAVMQQIKHSFGIRHWGRSDRRTGVLELADSICFAAPVFFHIVRYYWT